MRLKIIHIRTGAVEFRANRMSGSMEEVLPNPWAWICDLAASST